MPDVTTLLTVEQERRMRVILAPLQSLVPTKPGRYVDRGADVWTLNEDGTWTDHTGVTKDAGFNWMLAWNLPLTPVAIWQEVNPVADSAEPSKLLPNGAPNPAYTPPTPWYYGRD